MRTIISLSLAFAVLGAVACSSAEMPKGNEQDMPGETDGAPPTDVDESLLSLNGCTPAAYEDRSGDGDDRTIAIAKDGLVFTPKCMTIAVGQRVVWQGNLSAHPLAPGNPDDLGAGSPGSPIVSTAEGVQVEFEFHAAGTYPYHCTIHAFGAGRGMAGVVHVK